MFQDKNIEESKNSIQNQYSEEMSFKFIAFGPQKQEFELDAEICNCPLDLHSDSEESLMKSYFRNKDFCIIICDRNSDLNYISAYIRLFKDINQKSPYAKNIILIGSYKFEE